MTLYILPANLAKFQNRLNKMLSKFNRIPEVTYSDPKPMLVHTRELINRGFEGINKYKKYVTMVEVNIDDVNMDKEWVLVASVFYLENRVTMISPKYFSQIPEYMGLNYTHCDCCHHDHASRVSAHILYNKETGVWMQVGSSCVNKMFDQGKYFSTFTEQIYKIVEIFWGCAGDEHWSSWCAKCPEHYMQEAIPVDNAVAVTRKYYNEESTNWQKSYYEGIRKVGGTTGWINDYYDRLNTLASLNAIKDDTYFNNVKEFVKTLDGSNEFNRNIMDVFEFGYVNRFDMYTVFFAIKKYEDSLTVDFWSDIKSSYPTGQKADVINARVIGCTPHDGFYGITYEYVLEDVNKVKFMKSFSSSTGIDQYKDENSGLVSFSGVVTGYNDYRRCVIISGRVSKVKKSNK